jgi:hypothetical protein
MPNDGEPRRFDELKGAALELFGVVTVAARRDSAAETLRRMAAAEDRLRDSVLTVVVCGEFGRGKSTLLNALLEPEGGELLPTGIAYTTTLVTTIVYGPAERITVRRASAGETGPSGEPGAPVIEELLVDRDLLRNYVTQDGNPGNAERVLGVLIELPSDPLAAGLMLLDTPGIGGIYATHSTSTDAVLPDADAIVFVANAYQPLSGSEVRFLRRAIEAAGVRDERDALICALTRIDEESDYAGIVADTQAKLADATGWPAIPVVPVSSTRKLAYLDSRDAADLADSNFPALERVLWQTLARRRAKAILGSALRELDRSAAVLLDPLDTELAALRAGGPAAADDLRRRVEDRRRDLAGLSVAAATWRGDLARRARLLADEVLTNAQAQVDRARENVPGYLKDPDLLEETDRLLSRVGEDLSLVTSIADRQLYDGAGRLQRELAGQLGLDLGSAELGRLPAVPVPLVSDQPAPGADAADGAARGRGRRATPSTPTVITVSSTVGSVLGRVVGFFVVPGVGTLFGQAIGAGAGLAFGGALARWLNPAGAARRLPPGEVRKQLQADLDRYFADDLRPHITTHVTAVAAEWAAATAQEIDSQISQEQASVEQTAGRLQEPTPRDAERLAAREAALEAARRELIEVREGVTRLAHAAGELAAYGEP